MTDTVETRRKTLFAAYVDTVFAPQTSTTKTRQDNINTKEKSVPWLSFLSNRMQQMGRSLFFIEEMQFTWLTNHLVYYYRGIYGFLIGLITMLISMLVLTLSNSESIVKSPGLVIGGICTCFATALTTNIKQPKLRAFIGALIIGTIIGLIDGAIAGLLFGLGIILSAGGLSSWASFIQLREKVILLRPTWQRILRFMIGGIIVGLIFGLVVGTIFEPSGGLRVGIIFSLSGIMLAFLDTPYVDKRPQPSEGIKASLRNAIQMFLLSVVYLGSLNLIFERSGELDYFWLFLFLINILPPMFTWFGGLAWCQHWALRLVLARQKWLPLRLVPWLDSMVALGLLRRVGGGYIFIHRSLLEYFSELEEWPERAKIW